VVRVTNSSPYTQRVTISCRIDSGFILYSKDDAGDEQQWQETFRVPGRFSRRRRESSVRQALLLLDDASRGSISDENIWITAIFEDDARFSRTSLPEFAVQVDA
jgi:hypothetical protein